MSNAKFIKAGTFCIIAIAIAIYTLFNISNNKNELSQKDENKPQRVIGHGLDIYFNPKTNEECDNYNEYNSEIGVKDGCMKWWIYNIDDSDKVWMILDHNTTALVTWNNIVNKEDIKSGKIKKLYPDSVEKQLKEDTSSWHKDIIKTTRMLNSDELTTIYSENKASSSRNMGWLPEYFFDNITDSNWQYCQNKKQLSNEYGEWFECLDLDKVYGYWVYPPEDDSRQTSTYFIKDYENDIYKQMLISSSYDGRDINFYGVRPVISVPKSILE